MTQVQNQIAEVVPQTESKPRSFRFDVFKGVADSTGKIQKIKSVGSATLVDGCNTYTLYLKTFLAEVFYLLPERKKITKADFIILTRENARNPRRKYFWNNVGEGTVLNGENSGLVRLEWDVLGVDDLYLNLYPRNPTGE